MVERSKRTKATKKSRVKGVAGRSILKGFVEQSSDQVEVRRVVLKCSSGAVSVQVDGI